MLEILILVFAFVM